MPTLAKRIIALALAALIILLPAFCEEAQENDRAAKRLEELGYLAADADADAFTDALINFQRANSLSLTAAADPSTFERLFSAEAVSKAQYLAALSETQSVDIVLKLGDKGKNVKRLQQLLSDLGYYEGEDSGTYDLDTACALALFQLINGFEPNGICSAEVAARVVSPQALDAKNHAGKTELSLGDQGAQVRRAQKLLSRMGYFEGDCSGVFGSATQAAVFDFEQRNGLPTTGIWSVRYGVMAENGLTLTKAECLDSERGVSLSPGEEGYLVKELNVSLYELGYLKSAPSEEYGYDTVRALELFQEANGLEITGLADSVTRSRLSSGLCVNKLSFYNRCLSCPLKEGDSGYAVYLLTLRLSDLGYPTEPVRSYDSRVRELVQMYQTADKLSATGEADAQTRARINSEGALRYGRVLELLEQHYALTEPERRRQALLETALSAYSLPYEAGMIGPSSFGIGGFTYYCYGAAGIELAPTAALQLEAASARESFSQRPESIRSASQLFFRINDQLYTGISPDSINVIYASPESGRVIMRSLSDMTSLAEFVGTVLYAGLY